MKPKNILIAVILATLFFASTTTSQAQTKDETIDWLKENLKFEPTEYSEFNGFSLGFIDECSFEIRVRHQSGSMHLFVVPLNGLKIKYDGEMEFSRDAIKWIIFKTRKSSYIDRSTFFKIKDRGYDEYREKFKHLAGFCNK